VSVKPLGTLGKLLDDWAEYLFMESMIDYVAKLLAPPSIALCSHRALSPKHDNKKGKPTDCPNCQDTDRDPIPWTEFGLIKRTEQ
jgi:hypothetical protein